jgi:pyridoxine 4-dehydrogenase
MRLAGPGVWGPPRNVDAAVAVLRETTAAGVNHIDTSDFYGPHVTNQIIKQALYPYPDGLVIASKVGFRRGTNKSWLHAVSRQELIDAVHDNLRNLGLDTLDLVNLRVGGLTAPTEGSIEEPLTVLVFSRHTCFSSIAPLSECSAYHTMRKRRSRTDCFAPYATWESLKASPVSRPG